MSDIMQEIYDDARRTKSIVESELKNMLFDLLHATDIETIQTLYKESSSHVSAAKISGIFAGEEADDWQEEVDKAETFSKAKIGKVERKDNND